MPGPATSCTTSRSPAQSGSAPLSQRTLPGTWRPSTRRWAPSSTCRPLITMLLSALDRAGNTCGPRCASIGPTLQMAGCG